MVCKKCLINKNIEEFYKNKKIKSGYESKCKLCILEERKNNEEVKEYNKKYYKENKEKIYKKRIDKNKEYYILKKEEILEKRKIYYINNKDIIDDKNKEYVKNNKEYLNEYKKNWRYKNSEKIKDRHRYRMKNDYIYKVKYYLRTIVNRIKKSKNNVRTFDVIGCSSIEFKIYLESKFQPWMSWDNHGLYNGDFNYGWDIDHIIPLSSAKSEEELLKLSHYTNLQPLCSKVNRYLKRDIIDYEIL